jgi:hypothetical protein
MNLKFSLRLLSLFFWWYLIVFVLSVLPLLGVSTPVWLTLEFRGSSYVWDFELMFTAIFFVWGIFLWKAANSPKENKSLIRFTIWATAAHIATMLIIGVIQHNDLQHLLTDALVLSIPLTLVVFGYRKEFKV